MTEEVLRESSGISVVEMSPIKKRVSYAGKTLAKAITKPAS
jgi:hypothetical protein